MACEKYAQVHAYHDGELPAEEVAAVEAHIRECADCRELLGELRRLHTLIYAAPMAEWSAHAAQRVADKTWHREQDRGVLRITAWMTGLAAAILVATTLFWPANAHNEIAVSAASWQVAAVMPPADPDEPVSEVVLAAQWMANDLAPVVSAERQ